MSCIIKPNHIALSGSDAVRQICQPFFDSTGISHFTFARQYSDTSRFSLTTDPVWAEYFFSHRLYKNVVMTRGINEKRKRKYWLWIGLPLSDLQKDMMAFNIHNGITIEENYPNYIEYFYFGAKPDQYFMNNFFINNLDLLQRFIFFFKDQAADLIALSSQKPHKIIIPIDIKTAEKNSGFDDIAIIDQTEYQRSMRIKKIFIDHYGEFLTKREVDCILHLLQGKSASEAAKDLNIAKRTVDVHIENLKSKLRCKKKSELFRRLFELNLDILARN